MAQEHWTVERNSSGAVRRGLEWAVYDTQERDNRYVAYTFEKSMAEKIAGMLNTEDK